MNTAKRNGETVPRVDHRNQRSQPHYLFLAEVLTDRVSAIGTMSLNARHGHTTAATPYTVSATLWHEPFLP